MPTFPIQGLRPYWAALKAWLNTSINDDGTLKPHANFTTLLTGFSAGASSLTTDSVPGDRSVKKGMNVFVGAGLITCEGRFVRTVTGTTTFNIGGDGTANAPFKFDHSAGETVVILPAGEKDVPLTFYDCKPSDNTFADSGPNLQAAFDDSLYHRMRLSGLFRRFYTQEPLVVSSEQKLAYLQILAGSVGTLGSNGYAPNDRWGAMVTMADAVNDSSIVVTAGADGFIRSATLLPWSTFGDGHSVIHKGSAVGGGGSTPTGIVKGRRYFHKNNKSRACTIDPATNVFTVTDGLDHQLQVGDFIAIGFDPQNPPGSVNNALCYGNVSSSNAGYAVISTPTSTTFTISTVAGGAVLDITSAGSGVTFSPTNRRASNVDTTNNIFTCVNHNLVNDDRVRFVSPTTAPGGITLGTDYYAIVIDADNFKVSTTSGGAVVDVTSVGSNVQYITPYRYLVSDRRFHTEIVTNTPGDMRAWRQLQALQRWYFEDVLLDGSNYVLVGMRANVQQPSESFKVRAEHFSYVSAYIGGQDGYWQNCMFLNAPTCLVLGRTIEAEVGGGATSTYMRFTDLNIEGIYFRGIQNWGFSNSITNLHNEGGGTHFTKAVTPDAATNLITCAAHGLTHMQPVSFGGTPPAPLVAGVIYYVNLPLWLADPVNTFYISADVDPPGLPAPVIDLTDAGSSPTVQTQHVSIENRGDALQLSGQTLMNVASAMDGRSRTIFRIPLGASTLQRSFFASGFHAPSGSDPNTVLIDDVPNNKKVYIGDVTPATGTPGAYTGGYSGTPIHEIAYGANGQATYRNWMKVYLGAGGRMMKWLGFNLAAAMIRIEGGTAQTGPHIELIAGSGQTGYMVDVLASDGATRIGGVDVKSIHYGPALRPTKIDATVPGAGGSVAIDASAGSMHLVTVADSTAFTISPPTNPPVGNQTQTLTVIVFNNTAGAINAAFSSAANGWVFPTAFTQPAAGKRKKVTADWQPSLAKWIADVPSADY
jgi:hypothetical protein